MSVFSLTATDTLRMAAGLAGLGVIAYAWGIEPYNIEVTEREIEVPGLPDALDGLTICHLSDLHIGDFRRVERALAHKLSGREVDLCLISGDLLANEHGIQHLGRVLSPITARHGTYAVYGNAEHDPWASDIPIAERFEAHGIRTLINRGELVNINGEDVLVGGVDDPFLGYDDPDLALAGSESASLRILLAHAPDVVRDLGVHQPGLILAGHTHGGQIRLPIIGALWLHSRHPRLGISQGYYGPERLSAIAGRDLGHTQMYVCRGLGGSGIRARFLCRPEIVFLTLRKEDPRNR